MKFNPDVAAGNTRKGCGGHLADNI
jgi:hypothetical protein